MRKALIGLGLIAILLLAYYGSLKEKGEERWFITLETELRKVDGNIVIDKEMALRTLRLEKRRVYGLEQVGAPKKYAIKTILYKGVGKVDEKTEWIPDFGEKYPIKVSYEYLEEGNYVLHIEVWEQRGNVMKFWGGIDINFDVRGGKVKIRQR